MYTRLLPSVRLSDYQLESAYKDVHRRAPSMVTLNIFAVLVVRDNHVVLILVFKLVSFFLHLFTVKGVFSLEQATRVTCSHSEIRQTTFLTTVSLRRNVQVHTSTVILAADIGDVTSAMTGRPEVVTIHRHRPS